MKKILVYLFILLVLWPACGAIMYASLSNQTLIAQYQIKVAEKFKATITEVNKYKSSKRDTHYNYWVNYTYDFKNITRDGGGPIPENYYKAVIDGKKNKVWIYIHGSLIDGSWTAYDLEQKANRETIDNLFFGFVLGILPAFIIYYVIFLIRSKLIKIKSK